MKPKFEFNSPLMAIALTLTFFTGCSGGSSNDGDNNNPPDDVTNVAPVADAGGPYSGSVDDSIALNGSSSTDSDGSISLYEWDLDNDGHYDEATGVTASFDAEETGTFTVGLRVTDNIGATHTDTATVMVSDGDSITVKYPIVDSGQTSCYDESNSISPPAQGEAFYGQDALHSGNQPSYTQSGDGLTVYDNITGLTWTQSPDLDGDDDVDVDDKLTFSEAQTYPATLNAQDFGGYSDWRLPTMKELYSLMNFTGVDPSGYNGTDTSGLIPFIDTTIFDFGYGDTDAGERIIDSQFWSSNTYVATVMAGQTATFGLNLADGRIKGYPSDTDGPITKQNYVYFVRGNTDYGINDFMDNGDSTITDNATGLMWSQDDSGSGLNWQEALAWVAQKNSEDYLGYNDWRLPNVKELQSILDYSRAPDTTSSAAIAPLFNVTSITNEAGEVDYPMYWSSTTHVSMGTSSGSAGAYIAFGRAMGYMNESWIDVHGAGAQRSDPKVGDPADWPTGHGPQGDAIRIYNHVRLVRDVE